MESRHQPLNVENAIQAGLFTGRAVLEEGGAVRMQATAFRGNEVAGGVMPRPHANAENELVLRMMAAFIALCEADAVAVIADTFLREVSDLSEISVRPSEDPLAVDALSVTVLHPGGIEWVTQEYRRNDDGTLVFGERRHAGPAQGLIVQEMAKALAVVKDPPTLASLRAGFGDLESYAAELGEMGYIVALVSGKP